MAFALRSFAEEFYIQRKFEILEGRGRVFAFKSFCVGFLADQIKKKKKTIKQKTLKVGGSDDDFSLTQ